MRQYPSFPNPPITEALLDIRVNLPPDVTLNTLQSFQDSIRERFPNKVERVSWSGGFDFKKGTSPELMPPSGGPDGYFFKTLDGKKIVQARLDGFTFNKLKPYEHWEVFRDEAKELWELFKRIARPINVNRLALRYINSIELPLPISDFKKYVLTLPQIAKGIPGDYRNYFMRLEVVDKKVDAVAIVTETFKPPKDKATTLSLIFDIDAIKEIKVDPRDPVIWQIFEQLRQFKNEIFFNSMTRTSKEMFR